MAEQTAIITSTDITGRLSTQAYTRLFAKNGGSTVDTTFRDLCISEANSAARVMLRAAFPSGLYSTTDTIDEGVKGAVVDMACWLAASRHLSAEQQGGFWQAYERAVDLLKRISRDADARPPGSSATPSRPRASVTNTEDSAGVATNPYGRAADGRDGSAF